MTATVLPGRLAEVVEEFADLPRELRLEALLDYSRRVPPLPPHLAGNRDAMEQVHECQTPFFVASEVADDGAVILWFEAPPEAPTTRGFAGILAEGLNGASVEEVLAVPEGFYVGMGLHEVVSPLRLRGIGAILARVKRQVAAHAAARGSGGLKSEAGAQAAGGHAQPSGSPPVNRGVRGAQEEER